MSVTGAGQLGPPQLAGCLLLRLWKSKSSRVSATGAGQPSPPQLAGCLLLPLRLLQGMPPLGLLRAPSHAAPSGRLPLVSGLALHAFLSSCHQHEVLLRLTLQQVEHAARTPELRPLQVSRAWHAPDTLLPPCEPPCKPGSAGPAQELRC